MNEVDFLPYIRFLQIPQHTKGTGALLQNGNPKHFYGPIGYLTVKVMGDDLIREHIYNMIWISQYTGSGSNCNLGFGRNSVIKIQ